MDEEILPGLHRIEVPLPRNPLKALNAYLVRGRDRHLLVDTGMNRPECRDALQSGLQAVGVGPGTIDLFVTHLHADHSGLAAEFATDGTLVYSSQPDGESLNRGVQWEAMRRYAELNGFPAEELEQAITRHPANRYGLQSVLGFTHVRDGDTLEYGDYLFRCVSTPGHTIGHMCLYEPNRKILISGDHILDRITPNISLWTDARDPLGEYLESLEKVARLEVKLVLPSHRNTFTDLGRRIEQLRAHHEARCAEVLAILDAAGPLDAFQVASRMTWDLSYEQWDLFPVSQKWFAHGEALAHLRYLQGRGEVRREEARQKYLFSRQASAQ